MTFALTQSSTRRAWSFVVLAAGIGVVAALGWQIGDQIVRETFAPERYFSYFSVQTSVANAIALIGGGFAGIMGRREPRWFAYTRASLVVYAAMTAGVYNILLRPAVESGDPADRLLAWPLEATHVWIPIFLVVDWFIAGSHHRLGASALAIAAVYPAAWFVAAQFRAWATGWYPYAFMNPTEPAGWAGLTTWVGIIGAGFIILALAVIGANRLAHRRG